MNEPNDINIVAVLFWTILIALATMSLIAGGSIS